MMISELKIILKEETFQPGDIVEGTLLLQPTKDINIKDIVVTIKGSEQIEVKELFSTGKGAGVMIFCLIFPVLLWYYFEVV